METEDKFEKALASFIADAQAKIDTYMAKNFPNLGTVILEKERGSKYVRIVRIDTSKSVYCFVEIATGNILKAASYKTPAKGTRSNIYASDHGLSGVTEYGTIYKK